MPTPRETFLTLALGISFGVFVTYIVLETRLTSGGHGMKVLKETSKAAAFSYHYGTVTSKLDHEKLVPPDFTKDSEDEHHRGQDDIAKTLYNKTRVLCWVMTSPKTLYVKGKAVKATWGKRCNILLFMSSEADPSYPAIKLDVLEGRDHLWEKTRKAWRYVLQHHLNDADWFMKADDDTFVVVENLRHLVRNMDTEDAHFLGRKFAPFGSYNSGGAGYVFSRQALRIFGKLLDNPAKCKLQSWAEDVEVGRCFQQEGVLAGDTRDKLGRETFHCFPVEHHLIPGYVPKDNWLYKYNFFPYKDGPDCCSDHSVSFHYVGPNMMYVLEYLIYHLRPYGIGHSASHE